MKIILPLAFAVSGCGVKTYEIDGNKVLYDSNIIFFESSWVLREETKSGGINEYFFMNNKREEDLRKFKAKGKKSYKSKDSLVFSSAKQHVDYLFEKIDSLDKAERKQKEQERITYGLKALE